MSTCDVDCYENYWGYWAIQALDEGSGEFRWSRRRSIVRLSSVGAPEYKEEMLRLAVWARLA